VSEARDTLELVAGKINAPIQNSGDQRLR